jgi:hypothetical protein
LSKRFQNIGVCGRIFGLTTKKVAPNVYGRSWAVDRGGASAKAALEPLRRGCDALQSRDWKASPALRATSPSRGGFRSFWLEPCAAQHKKRREAFGASRRLEMDLLI